MKTDKLYIDQILDSIRKIESFSSGEDKKIFLANSMMQSAVILQLMLIGEVSKKISEETKSQVRLPWKQVIGFRDRAIHNYFNVNLNVVWDTVIMDIPVLKEQLGKFK